MSILGFLFDDETKLYQPKSLCTEEKYSLVLTIFQLHLREFQIRQKARVPLGKSLRFIDANKSLCLKLGFTCEFRELFSKYS